MPSARRQNAKAKKSREMDILSNYGNMHIVLGEGNANSIERDLDNVINGPERHQDFNTLPIRRRSSQENEIRNLDKRNGPDSQDGSEDSIEIL